MVVVVVVVVVLIRGAEYSGRIQGDINPIAYSYPANLPSCPITSLHAQRLRVEYSPQAIIANTGRVTFSERAKKNVSRPH